MAASGVVGRAADGLVLLGDVTVFAGRTVFGLFRREFRGSELLALCVGVGLSSIGVIAVTGIFIGMVLAVQSYSQLHQLGLETSIGGVIHLSVLRELGPVLSAVMLAGRVGSAMAAELGTMRVTEQLDAMACLGVDPVRHLVAPRFLACILMIPLLTILADVMGLLGSTAMCLRVFGIDSHHYWLHTQQHVSRFDLFVGLVKSVFFGGVIALIACHRGFHGTAGAAGVGQAATEAFVFSFIAILILDFVFGLLASGLQERFLPLAGPGGLA